MENDNTMGARIRKMRIGKLMTQEQLANHLFTKKSTISAYENNRIDMKCSVIKELANVLECSTSYLIEGDTNCNSLEILTAYKRLESYGIQKMAIEHIKILSQYEKGEYKNG